MRGATPGGIVVANVPEELKAVPQWVLWKEVERGGRKTKPPFRIDGTPGDSTDPNAWASFQEALGALKGDAYGFAGIGFTFSVYDPYVGVDLDNCSDVETGEIAAWAWEIIGSLDSYTEISPSGQGVHIIVKGRLPGERRRTGDIEMYDSDRFFTFTGKVVEGTRPNIERRQEALAALYRATFPPETKAIRAATESVDLDDAALLERAMNARNGEAFSRLWNGDITGYDSRSEADAALCAHLAFWTGGDAPKVDLLFRQSKLYRPDKWERETYRVPTIALALSGKREAYNPFPKSRHGVGTTIRVKVG